MSKKNMNSTLLKLLRKSFLNFKREMNKRICEINPCDPWSPSSKCSAREENTFGFRSRSRVCWLEKHEMCNRTGEQTVENDNNVCEGMLPVSYRFDNLWIKFFGESLNQSAAENVCSQDGGHLLNTDTEEKWTASVSILLSNKADRVWIDGTRTSIAAKWVFLNGRDPEANGVTSKWLSGQPTNKSYELCRQLFKSSG
ncbi:hypothetical protein DPMN_135404 [Dreissena polymorpha]|uniref:C-type lectin domain-containing protein n=1 Tax=Dreissena polymorpha TaxID=45954 RepID=A0A9D4G1H0_DREPO|nr:hypothetical protein DPMN_135404 [Dreissena polymorpha]